jgi:hypothetical protein
MNMSSDKAREIGEALIDAAVNADTLGIPCHVVFNEKLGKAVCLPNWDYEEEITHTVTPV